MSVQPEFLRSYGGGRPGAVKRLVESHNVRVLRKAAHKLAVPDKALKKELKRERSRLAHQGVEPADLLSLTAGEVDSTNPKISPTALLGVIKKLVTTTWPKGKNKHRHRLGAGAMIDGYVRSTGRSHAEVDREIEAQHARFQGKPAAKPNPAAKPKPTKPTKPNAPTKLPVTPPYSSPLKPKATGTSSGSGSPGTMMIREALPTLWGTMTATTERTLIPFDEKGMGKGAKLLTEKFMMMKPSGVMATPPVVFGPEYGPFLMVVYGQSGSGKTSTLRKYVPREVEWLTSPQSIKRFRNDHRPLHQYISDRELKDVALDPKLGTKTFAQLSEGQQSRVLLTALFGKIEDGSDAVATDEFGSNLTKPTRRQLARNLGVAIPHALHGHRTRVLIATNDPDLVTLLGPDVVWDTDRSEYVLSESFQKRHAAKISRPVAKGGLKGSAVKWATHKVRDLQMKQAPTQRQWARDPVKMVPCSAADVVRLWPQTGPLLMVVSGESGTGKHRLLEKFQPDHKFWVKGHPEWDKVDVIEAVMRITHKHGGDAQYEAATAYLHEVAFNSVPAWMSQYGHISTGQRARVDLTEVLSFLDAPGFKGCVINDKLGSDLDAMTRQAVSFALARAFKRRRKDGRDGSLIVSVVDPNIIAWMRPDLVYDTDRCRYMVAHEFLAKHRSFLTSHHVTRPLTFHPIDIRLSVHVVSNTLGLMVWSEFKHHHYMSHTPSGYLWILLTAKGDHFAEGREKIVGVMSIGCNAAWGAGPKKLPFLRQAGRFVVSPSVQGVGFGTKFISMIGALLESAGLTFNFVTSHPQLVRHFQRSPEWAITKGWTAEGRFKKSGKNALGIDRSRWSYTYAGPAAKPAAPRPTTVNGRVGEGGPMGCKPVYSHHDDPTHSYYTYSREMTMYPGS